MPHRREGNTSGMAEYVVNTRGVAKARASIKAQKYRVRSRWIDVQPGAAEQNAFLRNHSWNEYGSWHLALNTVATRKTSCDE